MQAVHHQVKEKGGKVNSVTEFNQGMARGLMLDIAMLQDDLHDFQKLNKIENGLPLTPLHASSYNEILEAKHCLERVHNMLSSMCLVNSLENFHGIEEDNSVSERINQEIRCSRCSWTWNELFYMYRKCSACNGSGIAMFKDKSCAV